MTLQPDADRSTGFPQVQIIGINGMPEIEPGDPLGETIVEAAEQQGTPLQADDILVVTQKIVSKAEGRIVDLAGVEPSAFANRLATEMGRDPRLLELVLRESWAIVRMDTGRGIMITETRQGFVCANSGIDTSNVPGDGRVSLLPVDADLSARRLREEIAAATSDVTVAVIISDTFGRAWREGHVNFAIGVDGISPLRDYRGATDAHGMVLKVTNIAVADELAAAAELVTEKAIGVPVAIVRGFRYDPSPDGVHGLLRQRSNDLFR